MGSEIDAAKLFSALEKHTENYQHEPEEIRGDFRNWLGTLKAARFPRYPKQEAPRLSGTCERQATVRQKFGDSEGDKLSVTIVEVNYGPGESSPPQSHPCPVIGYVLEGTLRTQVKGEPEAIYKAGESFYEARNAVHMVSGNASDKERARLLAYFVCDQHSPLSVAAPE